MFVIEYVPIYSIGTLEMNISGVQTTVYIKLKTAEGDSAVASSSVHPSERPRSKLDEYCLQMHRIHNENVWLIPPN